MSQKFITLEQAQAIIQFRTSLIEDANLRNNVELDLMYTELDQVGELTFPLSVAELESFILNRITYLSVTSYVQRLLEVQLGRGVDYVDNYNSDLTENIATFSAMIIDEAGETDRENEITVKVEIGPEIPYGIAKDA